ncbi:MAG: hypothetical protein RBS53_09415 [Bacteroidales bacterium]|jgi:hypothetical protein|nr:hypothetical protein [Bacteroidales bacterium]
MKTKTILLLFCFAFLWGCSKIDSEIPLEPSVFVDEYAGYFVRDLLVFDEDSINSAYFRIYAKNERELNKFIDIHDFRLGIFKEEESLKVKESLAKTELLLENKPYQIEDYLPDLKEVEDNVVTIELITDNIFEFVSFFYLEIIENQLTNKNLESHLKGSFPDPDHFYWTNQSSQTWRNPIRFANHPFVGIISFQTQWPNQPYATRLVRDWLLGSWRYFDGYKYTKIDVGVHFEDFWNWYNRIAFEVTYPKASSFSPADTYLAVYKKDDYRGRDCTIGTFDTRNCYVATAPVGTTAFVFPDKFGHLYHTHLPGNDPCPLPGSASDGHNCWVAAIPNGTSGFVIGRNLYVRPNLLPTD